MFFLCLDRLLVGRRKHFVPLIIIIGLVLTSILGIASILRVGNNYTAARLTIEVNGFLITGIRGYIISVLFDIIS
jgi:hypothetical protein